MKITTIKDLLQGVYKTSVGTSDFSENDNKLMADYGEPTINVGGTFHGTRPDIEGSIDLTSGHDWSTVHESFILAVNGGSPVTFEADEACATLGDIVTLLNGLLHAEDNLDAVVQFYDAGSGHLGLRTVKYGEDRTFTLSVPMAGTFLTTVGLTGGTYTGTGSQYFQLPNDYRRIMSESPFVEGFDTRDEQFAGAAQIAADLWTETIIDEIKAALDTLRANSDTFTGETVETY